MIIQSGIDNGIYVARVAVAGWTVPEYRQIVDWCLDNFGIDREDHWQFNRSYNTFQFAREEDFILFVLRWA